MKNRKFYKKIKLNCKICNGEFEVCFSRQKKAKFCSKICKNKSQERKIPWNKGKKFPQYSGKNNPNYGKQIATEIKEKIRINNFKRYASGEKFGFQKGNQLWKLQKTFRKSPETIKKIRIKLIGKIPWNKGKRLLQISGEKHPGWKGGFPKCIDCEKCLSQRKAVRCKKCNNKFRIGFNSQSWEGGKTPLYKMIRTFPEDKQWKKDILRRDNYACQECFAKGEKLNVHHKNIPWLL